MLNDKVSKLLEGIARLEAELEAELAEQRERFNYYIEKRRVYFGSKAIALQRGMRVGLLRYMAAGGSWRDVVAAPFIFTLLPPLLLLDLFVSLYQAVCFRLYDIPRVRRSDFIVVDRHQLAYLNILEKINCAYCGYANGLIAYCRVIAARTEQFWCPIKHARRRQGMHENYPYFLDYGDAEGYRKHRHELRDALSKEDGK